MLNQATALLIETGKIGRVLVAPGDATTPHSLRGLHRIDLLEQPDAAATKSSNLDDNAQLDLQIEVGRARLSLDEVQSLRDGSVIALDAKVDEPVTILAGSRPVGRGEIVLLDGKIGIRVVELAEDF